jgi:CO/xanthine dehydrogenase FAD-binding subunit
MNSTVKVYRPSTLKDACTVLAETSSQIVNGGTCFSPAVKDRRAPGPLLDLSRLKELKVIQTTNDAVRIGGRITWSEIATAELPPCFDVLKQAARKVGSIQIQNVATVAGNLCNASSAADGVPPLLALDAEVELMSSAAQRRIGLWNFIVGDRKTIRCDDEILTAIIVPRTIDTGESVFFKLGARSFLAASIVTVAVVVEQDAMGRARQVRVAAGSCSPVAQRLRNLEPRLVRKRAEPGLGDVAVEADLAALCPGDDVQATAAYRRDAALTLVRRAIDACIGVS